ncbi:hypothetical protein JQS43_25785 [Natronosporangium hydrolyticum]|uniref:asparagine synthase (glutamine-hydrolyzing) n=1 Tax=Natronosporangium hydrolyticum TaxID=2811111 RepID=A0A895YL33_9ACTN|nr:hypothetical protein [Natronosporangium hydrolyticum]QSB14810.1 hypothetical protein JQS43_25785 [Natronosporangium hydrolyticum]
MSGIAGYVNMFGDAVDEATLRRMARQLEPRGPAGESIVRQDRVGLVQRRRTTPTSPLRAGGGRYLWVYDGEVYNHTELRAALTELGESVPDEPGEVLFASWRRWGAAGLDRCDGMFAIAVLDTETGELVLARDPSGARPLYLAADDSGRVAFGSSLRAVLAAGVVPRRPDNITVYRYIRYGALDDTERTFFDRISRLLPGELATISPAGQVRRETYSRCYAELELLAAARRPYDAEAEQQLAAELAAARQRRGGDAAANLPELATEPPPADAAPPTLAELVEFIRTQHEPVGSPAAYGQFRHLAAAPARAAVLLAGDATAYHPGPGVRRWAALAGRWPDRFGRWLHWHPTTPATRLLGAEFAAAHAEDPPPYAVGAPLDGSAMAASARRPAPPLGWPATWLRQLLPPGGLAHEHPPAVVFQRRLAASLRYADRNAARFATTVRAPLLDPALLRLLWSLGPIAGPVRGAAERRAVAGWLSRLAPVIEQVFTSGSFVGRRYFDQPAVLEDYRGFLAGRRRVDPLLFWRLVNLELWLAEWIDRDPTWPPANTQVEYYRCAEPAPGEPVALDAAAQLDAAESTQERLGSNLRRTSPTTSVTSEIRSSNANPR